MAILFFFVSLAGCGGERAFAPGLQSANVKQQLTLSIRIPKNGSHSAKRSPLYISPSTQSVAISVNAAAASIANLTPSSPGCTSAPTGEVICTISVSAPPGNDLFEETLYDQVQQPGATIASGNPLSHVKQIFAITTGQANTIALTLDGVPAKVSLQTLANTPIVQGSPATISVMVVAQDAGGNTIIGSDPYDTPIALKSNDASGAITISKSSVLNPADSVTLGYTGAAVSAVTISSSLAGSLAGNIASAGNLIVPAPKTPNTTDWTTFGFDTQRSGNNPSETTLGAGNVAGLTLKWSVNIPGGGFADTQPLVITNELLKGVYTDLVVVGDEHGHLTAFNALDGSLAWQKQLGAQNTPLCHDIPDGVWGITGTPAVDRPNDRLYVVDGAGNMSAIALATGSTLWGPLAVTDDPAQDHVYSAVTFDAPNHRAYVTTASYCDNSPSAEGIRAVDTSTGSIAAGPLYLVPPTSSSIGGSIYGPGGLALDPRGGDLYAAVGGDGKNVSGFENGIVRISSAMQPVASNAPSTTLLDPDFGGSPAVYQDGGVCLAAEQKTGILYVYNLDNIAAGPTQSIQIGRGDSEGVAFGTPAYANHFLYVPNANSGLFPPGLLIFSVQPGCQLGTPAVAAFGPNDAAPFSPPVVANGVAYAGDGVGKNVYALDAISGKQLWSTPLKAPTFTAPTIANGRLYVSSWKGNISAFGLP